MTVDKSQANTDKKGRIIDADSCITSDAQGTKEMLRCFKLLMLDAVNVLESGINFMTFQEFLRQATSVTGAPADNIGNTGCGNARKAEYTRSLSL